MKHWGVIQATKNQLIAIANQAWPSLVLPLTSVSDSGQSKAKMARHITWFTLMTSYLLLSPLSYVSLVSLSGNCVALSDQNSAAKHAIGVKLKLGR